MEYWKFTNEQVNDCIASLLADSRTVVGMTINQVRDRYFKKPESTEGGTLNPQFLSAELKPSEWGVTAFGVSAPYSDVIRRSGSTIQLGFFKPVQIPYLCVDLDDEGKIVSFDITRDGRIIGEEQYFAVPTLPEIVIANTAGYPIHTSSSATYADFITGRGLHTPKSYTEFRSMFSDELDETLEIFYLGNGSPYSIWDYPLGGKITRYKYSNTVETGYATFVMLSDEISSSTSDITMRVASTSAEPDTVTNANGGALQRVMVPMNVLSIGASSTNIMEFYIPMVYGPQKSANDVPDEYPLIDIKGYFQRLSKQEDSMSIDEIISELSGRFAAV